MIVTSSLWSGGAALSAAASAGTVFLAYPRAPNGAAFQAGMVVVLLPDRGSAPPESDNQAIVPGTVYFRSDSFYVGALRPEFKSLMVQGFAFRPKLLYVIRAEFLT